MKKIAYILFSIFFAFSLPSSASGNLLKDGKLKNSLTYRIYKSENLPIISLNIKIKAGSYFDKKFGEANITANCLETCATKDLSSEKFRRMVDRFGGEVSSSAAKEYININARFPLKYTERMFCLVSQMLKSRFDDKNFEFVKKEALDNLKSLQEDKDYLAIHAAFVNLIKQKAYSHTSLGTFDGIKSIRKSDVVDFFKNHVNAQNMVLSVSGGISDFKGIGKLIMRYFSFLPKGKASDFKPVLFKSGLNVKNIIKPAKQSYIYLAFRGFPKKDRRYYAADVLAFILGGNLNSVLAQDVRTRHGYAYSVFAFNYGMENGGVFVVGLQTQNRYTIDALKRVFEDIKHIDNFIKNERINNAKTYLKGKEGISLQSSLSVANALSSAYMLKKTGLPWKNFDKNIDSVTKDDVKSCAKTIFSNVSIGIVSKISYEDKIKKLAKDYGY